MSLYGEDYFSHNQPTSDEIMDVAARMSNHAERTVEHMKGQGIEYLPGSFKFHLRDPRAPWPPGGVIWLSWRLRGMQT